MPQRGQRDALDVVRRHEVAPRHQRDGAPAAHERERAARARAERQARPLARRTHDAHGVVDDLLVDALARDEPLQIHDEPLVEHRLHGAERQLVAGLVRRRAHDDADLLGERRVADLDLEQEPVELRLRQRIRAFGFDGVLRREHHERLRQRQRLPLERHLVLLHDLEQRALRLRRCAIDLVGEQHVREHGPAHDAQLARARDRARRDP